MTHATTSGRLTLLRSMLSLALWLICCGAHAAVVIDNPYAAVDWENTERLKVNLHAHTRQSDGKMQPAEVIDAYQAANYAALALTDHNTAAWPWTDFGRDPAALGIIAIAGNEFSSGHHRNILFALMQGDPGSDVAATVRQAEAAGGLMQLNHPGRYDRPIVWYVGLLRDHANIVALEVFNQGDRYPGDRQTWDAILTETMPGRPVWGTSNDDMHKRKHLYRNYNIVLSESDAIGDLRVALEQGRSYFSLEPAGSGAARAPHIKSVALSGASITLTASAATTIVWIADGETVATGPSVDVAPLVTAGRVNGYIRARLEGPDGITCTQPFGVRTDAGADGTEADAPTDE